MIRSIRKWWFSWRYGICRVHGTLMRMGGGYDPKWICDTCIEANRGKAVNREKYDHLRRIEMQKRFDAEFGGKR
jgi:hypothetical protein